MATVLRYISLVLIVASLMLLGGDVLTSLEKGEFTVRSLAQVWTMIDKPSLDGFKLWLDHTLPASLAGILTYCLNVWSWLPFGILGVAMAFGLTRRSEYEA
jgi:hypothetical protein